MCEPALVTAVAVAVTEVVTFPGALVAARGCFVIIAIAGTAHIAVSEAAFVAALAVTIVAKVEAFPRALLAARTSACPATVVAATIVTVVAAMRELAILATFTFAIVTEGKALFVSSRSLLHRFAFMLAAALITIVASPTEVVAADLVFDVVSTSVVRSMCEAAAVAVCTFAGVAPGEAFAALAAASGGLNGFAFGVLELAFVTKTASAVVTERSAHLNLNVRHLK